MVMKSFMKNRVSLLCAFMAVVMAGCAGDYMAIHDLIEQRDRNAKIDYSTGAEFRKKLDGNREYLFLALREANANEDHKLMLFLLEDPDIRSWRKLNPDECRKLLDICCNKGVVKNVLDKGIADPHSLSSWGVGYNPLFTHAMHGNECGARIELIRHFCDVNLRNRRGFTPLHYAAWRGGTNGIKELLEHGADITAVSYTKKSVLHLASLRADDDPSAAELLLDAGADIDARDAWGNTPLFYAHLSKNGKIQKLLLQRGASKDVKNKSGRYFHSAQLTKEIASGFY